MAANDDLNTSTIAMVGFLGAVIVFAVIVLLTVIFYRVQAEQEYEKDVSQAYEQVSKLKADQQGKLASYGWVSQEKGVARIPVNRAMDLIAAELSRDPSADVTGAASEDVQPPETSREQSPGPQRSDPSADQADSASDNAARGAGGSPKPQGPPTNNFPVSEGDSPIFPAGKSGQSPSYSSAAPKMAQKDQEEFPDDGKEDDDAS